MPQVVDGQVVTFTQFMRSTHILHWFTPPSGSEPRNAAGPEDTLINQTLAAGLLATDGQALCLKMFGKVGANTANKRLRLKLGGVTIYDQTFTDNDVQFKIEAEFIRIGQNVQRCMTELRMEATSGPRIHMDMNFTTLALGNAIPVAFSAEAPNTGDVIIYAWHMWLMNT